MERRTFLGASAAVLAAATYPTLLKGQSAMNGRLISGMPAGVVGDRLAGGMLDILHNQFDTHYTLEVIESRETRDASAKVKSAPPDGTTLLQSHSGPLVLFPATYRTLDYDPLDDFTPIALMGDYSFALAVGPAVPASITDINGYLGWVKENPDYRDIGFSVYGSQAHLASLMLTRSKEVALRPQSYRTVPSMANDMGNETLAAGVTMTGNLALLREKQLRPIAVTTKSRLAAWPNVATFAEQGVPDMDLGGWFGWFAPANMAPATSQMLAERIAAAQATDAYAALQRQLMLTQVTLPPDQIRERISQEMSTYARIVSTYGLSRMT